MLKTNQSRVSRIFFKSRGERMLPRVFLITLLLSVKLFAAPGLTVTSPQDGWSVNSPIYFAASAVSPTCAKGIATIRIYAAPHMAVFSIDAAQFETFVHLKPGTYETVVQAWDNCGELTKVQRKVTVMSTAGVTVYSPAARGEIASPARFVASASSPACPKGISAIRVYTAPGVEAHTESANHLDAEINLAPGNYNAVVQAWDNCGHVFKVPIITTVKPATPPQAPRVPSF